MGAAARLPVLTVVSNFSLIALGYLAVCGAAGIAFVAGAKAARRLGADDMDASCWSLVQIGIAALAIFFAEGPSSIDRPPRVS